MSLDVYLSRAYQISYDNGETLEEGTEELYSANITHNLTKMADEAGIYKACWHPEEIGAKKAKDIIPLLKKGYEDLRLRPDFFKQFNSPNGWGMYEHFYPWVKEYLEACKEHPEANIETST